MKQKGGWFRGTIDTNNLHRSYTSDNSVNDVPNEEDWIQVEKHYIGRLPSGEYWLTIKNKDQIKEHLAP